MTNFAYNQKLNRFDKFATRGELKRSAIAEQIEINSSLQGFQFEKFQLKSGYEIERNLAYLKKTENNNFFFAFYSKDFKENVFGYCDEQFKVLRFLEDDEMHPHEIWDTLDFVNAWGEPWQIVTKEAITFTFEKWEYIMKLNSFEEFTACCQGTHDFIMQNLYYFVGCPKEIKDFAERLKLSKCRNVKEYFKRNPVLYMRLKRLNWTALNQIFNFSVGYDFFTVVSHNPKIVELQ